MSGGGPLKYLTPSLWLLRQRTTPSYNRASHHQILPPKAQPKPNPKPPTHPQRLHGAYLARSTYS